MKYKKDRNLKGIKFGRLTAIRSTSVAKSGQPVWLCKCECGKRHEAVAANLMNGNTRSCGCLKTERLIKENIERATTHGKSKTPEYGVWIGMRNRCEQKNNQEYSNYGGRGIAVCERWSEFENFYTDMGERPTTKHSIDRLDNDGGYSPENCQWATCKEQCRNKRNNRQLTYNGETRCVTEWSEVLRINPRTIFTRLFRGWSVDRALGKQDAV